MLLNFTIFAIIVVTLYFLMIMPKLHHHPDWKRFDGRYYAHRGLHNNKSEAPENSLKAFGSAVNHNYGIELDVQLTKDKIPVILHDYNLNRACGVDHKVSDLTYDELKEYHLFGSNEKIPTLREVLQLVDGRVPLIIELKIPWRAEDLCEKVSEILKEYGGSYCIESFNPFGLMWYKKHCPKIIRGQLSTDFNREKIEGSKVQYFILKYLLLNFLTKPDFIAFHHVYKSSLSFHLCRKLFRVKPVAWTIQSQEELEDNRKFFDLFIFDSFIPDRNREV